MEVLNYIKGFIVDTSEDGKSVFLNCYPQFKSTISNSEVIRLTDGKAQVTDVLGDKIFWSSNNSDCSQVVTPSHSQHSFLITSLNKVYLVDKTNFSSPLHLKISPLSVWSIDDKYLYWLDKNKKQSFAYDIQNNTINGMGSYIFKAIPGKSLLKPDKADALLYNFGYGNGYKRISLTVPGNSDIYTYIERDGEVVIKGDVQYSPDKLDILYNISGKGYYISSLGGANIKFLGNADDASWVNNTKILLKSGSKMELYSREGKALFKSSKKWRQVGKAENGSVFYTVGSDLYCEANGISIKIIRLPKLYDYIYSKTENGPYFAISYKDDSVYCIQKNQTEKISDYKALLGNSGNNNFEDIINDIIISKDAKNTALLVNKNGFGAIEYVSTDGGILKQRLMVLNSIVEDGKKINLNAGWISNKELLVFSDANIWVIDFNGYTKIYKISSAQNSFIKGMITN
jgi:hypothetical protein